MLVGLVTASHMLSLIMKKRVKTTDPISKAIYKQFKTVSQVFFFRDVVVLLVRFYSIKLS